MFQNSPGSSPSQRFMNWHLRRIPINNALRPSHITWDSRSASNLLQITLQLDNRLEIEVQSSLDYPRCGCAGKMAEARIAGIVTAVNTVEERVV